MINYDKKYVFEHLHPRNIEQLNELKRRYPSLNILVEIPNTQDLSSEMLKKLDKRIAIRVAGGYDKNRIDNCNDIQYENGETGEYFTTAVIYTRNELVKIIEEMEKIESKLDSNWSSLQKTIYIYNALKNNIMYDPKYKTKPSSEVRSLRGFISRQTVCAGYSLMFKEMLERQGITCHYVEGKSHAWNIMEIDGKLYPIDLTWDNSHFRRGRMNTYSYFGQDVASFSKSHVPNTFEPIQNYEDVLSNIDRNLIEMICAYFPKEKDFETTTYHTIRNDGMQYIISQVGAGVIDKKIYYKYCYREIKDNGDISPPLILYSDTNIMYYFDNSSFGHSVSSDFTKAIRDVLFSVKNINDSLRNGTFYIGGIEREKENSFPHLVKDISKMKKSEAKRNVFDREVKIYKRSDNSSLFVEKRKCVNIDGTDIYEYGTFETVLKGSSITIRENRIFSERDLFLDRRRELADEFLSRERIDELATKTGGYLGYFDIEGVPVFNPDLIEYFNPSRHIDIDEEKMQQLPTFQELKILASHYEVYSDASHYLDNNPRNIRVRDTKTKKEITDPKTIEKAIFANIWLTSAGVKMTSDDKRMGDTYAFNDGANKVYDYFCSKLNNDVKKNGVIDTVGLFANADLLEYKHSREIIINLFRSSYQTNFINDLFCRISKTKVKALDQPEPLYCNSYARDLAFGSSDNNVGPKK